MFRHARSRSARNASGADLIVRRAQHRRQMFATFGRLNPPGDTEVFAVGEIHQIWRGEAELAGQARALFAHGLAHRLHHDLLPLMQQRGDGRFRRGWLAIGAGVGIGGGGGEVAGVHEGGSFEANIDERRLHARQHPHDNAEVDVADDAPAPAVRALDLDPHLSQHAVLQQGDPGFPGGCVDEQFRGHDRWHG